MDFSVRQEQGQDVPAIFTVNQSAFGRDNEARLVDQLRDSQAITLSLVAERRAEVVGHILFSPVTITSEAGQWTAVALGPIAVRPDCQGQGIGAALIRAAFEALKPAGQTVVIVLGHAAYYPRFGFKPSKPLGIQWEVAVPDEVFMVAELSPGALNGRAGIVRYHPAFNAV